MPAKSGWQVCKILKSQEKTKHIPIIIFTVLSVAIGDENSKRRAEEAGADGYIPKPFNTNELLSEVKKYVEQ
jgi:CheY-like chemotaxis protein